jgi:hypothetical protein
MYFYEWSTIKFQWQIDKMTRDYTPDDVFSRRQIWDIGPAIKLTSLYFVYDK